MDALLELRQRARQALIVMVSEIFLCGALGAMGGQRALHLGHPRAANTDIGLAAFMQLFPITWVSADKCKVQNEPPRITRSLQSAFSNTRIFGRSRRVGFGIVAVLHPLKHVPCHVVHTIRAFSCDAQMRADFVGKFFIAMKIILTAVKLPLLQSLGSSEPQG